MRELRPQIVAQTEEVPLWDSFVGAMPGFDHPDPIQFCQQS
jgi:hypothetical protein